MPLLDVQNLSVSYFDNGRWNEVTHNVSFQLESGEALALVGESGSGKTTTAQAILGLLQQNARIETGKIFLNGEDLGRFSKSRLEALRGKVMSLIPQDPSSSLDPLMKIGNQIGEIFRIHKACPPRQIKSRVVKLLREVGLDEPELRAEQYPHQLSGGMRQRVLIAIAIALKPQLIIADEPTSALDVTVQKRILDLIDDIRVNSGASLLMVTHDLGVASDRADKIIVMNEGRVEEAGESQIVLSSPRQDYTKKLVANDPSLTLVSPRPKRSGDGKTIVEVKNLVIDYAGKQSFRAVENLSFKVNRGTTHAIVGESGSGKTSTIRALCGFIRPGGGTITIDGSDMMDLKGEELRHFRRRIQLVSQNPFGSLDPHYTIGKIIEEPLLNYPHEDKSKRRARVLELLDQVELPKSVFDRLPRGLSGGQRQRVAIARALVLNPDIVVLDEAVSALDVTVQAQILALLERLQNDYNLTYIFVSHDLSVVRQISDSVTVLKHGHEVESGKVEEIFTHPRETYTRELIAAIPGKKNALHQSLLGAQL
ncbi:MULTISPECIES: ABC transporter ATP-binding protein [Bartonella]|uniref:dipeptide ABC transporter ATP-binding protein n=1 Tax=Bartonella TaxID=773 RepID=UPI0018DC3961|nr:MULTISPECIES: ABC transporter ATP-binding protein [Bartonella]MBH9994037.1 ABC transporter ATP-binding protein [Bartonella sp. P0291]MBH9997618.1 ABC transporter ATP-binding protein [Bartonella sp. M0192]MBH9999778.1 ABC transporter ATP-binding protein [Bartonella sp. M0191]MBI0008328.1 ABC transporter ATP-binding protein [Bartonella sp. M0193]MBI0011069.1 ABC transporter ATP-binding protein [Bartonella sp. M0176]